MHQITELSVQTTGTTSTDNKVSDRLVLLHLKSMPLLRGWKEPDQPPTLLKAFKPSGMTRSDPILSSDFNVATYDSRKGAQRNFTRIS